MAPPRRRLALHKCRAAPRNLKAISLQKATQATLAALSDCHCAGMEAEGRMSDGLLSLGGQLRPDVLPVVGAKFFSFDRPVGGLLYKSAVFDRNAKGLPVRYSLLGDTKPADDRFPHARSVKWVYFFHNGCNSTPFMDLLKKIFL